MNSSVSSQILCLYWSRIFSIVLILFFLIWNLHERQVAGKNFRIVASDISFKFEMQAHIHRSVLKKWDGIWMEFLCWWDDFEVTTDYNYKGSAPCNLELLCRDTRVGKYYVKHNYYMQDTKNSISLS